MSRPPSPARSSVACQEKRVRVARTEPAGVVAAANACRFFRASRFDLAAGRRGVFARWTSLLVVAAATSTVPFVVRGDGRGVRLADASPRGDCDFGGISSRGVAAVFTRPGDGKERWDLAGMTGRAPGSCAHTLRWDAGAVARVVRAVRSST